jgi:predicted Zn-dependent peptidase
LRKYSSRSAWWAVIALFGIAAIAAADDDIVGRVNIEYEMFRLDNGLTTIVHSDHSTPTIFVGIWYGVGSKDEPDGKTGFAHLFEHLMFQSTENHEGEFFEPFTKAGATGMNGTTSEDRTNYYATVPTGALDMALWMESDRMSHLLGAVTQEALDEQRGVVQNEKRQGENRPYAGVYDRVRAGI